MALVLIAVIAGFLYFDKPAPPKLPEPTSAAPRVVIPPESLFDRLSRQARSGDVVSQRQLGEMYYRGLEVRQDYDEAIKWLRMAGDKGDKIAARYMGFAYSGGRGVAVDISEAASWWRLASSKGDDDSTYQLAFAYLNGKVSPSLNPRGSVTVVWLRNGDITAPSMPWVFGTTGESW